MNIDYTVNCLTDEELQKSSLQLMKFIKPTWDPAKISCKQYSEGLTNKLVGYYCDNFDDQVLVRVYGDGTESYIDRNAEMEAVKLLQDYGLGSKLYALFKNGYCYGYTPGTPLTIKNVSNNNIYPKVAKLMASMNKIEIEDRTPLLFSKTKKFIELIPATFSDSQLQKMKINNMSKESLGHEVDEIEKIVKRMESLVVFSHNDLLVHNIIFNEQTETIHFIDYEYAFPNYLYFDVADHFCEFAGIHTVDYNLYPEADFARKFLKCYISTFRNIPENEVCPSEVEEARKKTNVLALSSHLFWICWAVMQAGTSSLDFDYLGYSILRFNEYKRRKEEFISALSC